MLTKLLNLLCMEGDTLYYVKDIRKIETIEAKQQA